jgi:hypothetical protein
MKIAASFFVFFMLIATEAAAVFTADTYEYREDSQSVWDGYEFVTPSKLFIHDIYEWLPEVNELPVPIINEPFSNNNFTSRGWNRTTAACTYVYDKVLEKNVCHVEFVAGSTAPVAGVMGMYYYLPANLEEFTLRFKMKWTGDDVPMYQTLHGIYILTEKAPIVGDVPQSSHGTLYVDPNKSSSHAPGGINIIYQDTENISCPEGQTDLYPSAGNVISEDRSVGGCQQSYQQDSNINAWCSYLYDFCAGVSGNQSGWSIYSDGQTDYAMQSDEWMTIVVYVKLNTPGVFDGIVTVDMKRPGDTAYTRTILNTEAMFRSLGSSSDFDFGRLLFGPYASANTYDFTVRYSDLLMWDGDVRPAVFSDVEQGNTAFPYTFPFNLR